MCSEGIVRKLCRRTLFERFFSRESSEQQNSERILIACSFCAKIAYFHSKTQYFQDGENSSSFENCHFFPHKNALNFQTVTVKNYTSALFEKYNSSSALHMITKNIVENGFRTNHDGNENSSKHNQPIVFEDVFGGDNYWRYGG
jgi:predicted ATP-dependent protease